MEDLFCGSSCQFCSHGCINEAVEKEKIFHTEIDVYCKENNIKCNLWECFGCKYNYYCGQ